MRDGIIDCRLKLGLPMGFRIELLGDFRLASPDGPVEVDSKKGRALLAYLACEGRPHSRSTLATLLWGSHFETQARQNLRQTLTKLRRLLGEAVLIADGETVAINAATVTSDAQEFDALCDADTIEACAQAIQLYKGPFARNISVTEVGWTEWAEGPRRRYEKRMVDATVRLGIHELAEGRAAQALDLAQRGVTVERLREDCQRLLIGSLAALGRGTEAVQHYERFAQFLQQELSVEPEPATKDLVDELRANHSRPSANSVGGSRMIALPSPLIDRVGPPNSAVADGAAPSGLGTAWRAPARPLVIVALALVAGVAAAIYTGPSLGLWRESARGLGAPQTRLASHSAPSSAGRVLKHCDVCPEMVVVPPGEFVMGSVESEIGRDETEGPQRRIVISRSFAIGRHHVTIGQFETFVKDINHPLPNQCKLHDIEQNRFVDAEGSFRSPGFKVLDSKPAVCVTWSDAKSYSEWLARKTGKPYRLPSEAEFEYAARAGTSTPFSWGDDPSKACEFARFADLASSWIYASTCYSKIVEFGPAPAASLKPNPWGLHDIHGNAWEFVEDCWASHYRFHPADGSPLATDNCQKGVFRGGGWHSRLRYLRPAGRLSLGPQWRSNTHGFRVALTLDD